MALSASFRLVSLNAPFIRLSLLNVHDMGCRNKIGTALFRKEGVLMETNISVFIVPFCTNTVRSKNLIIPPGPI